MSTLQPMTSLLLSTNSSYIYIVTRQKERVFYWRNITKGRISFFFFFSDCLHWNPWRVHYDLLTCHILNNKTKGKGILWRNISIHNFSKGRISFFLISDCLHYTPWRVHYYLLTRHRKNNKTKGEGILLKKYYQRAN